MKILLIGFDAGTLQGLKERISNEILIQQIHTIEEAEHIMSVSPTEIGIIVINDRLVSEEKIIKTGEFVERIRVLYQEPIIIITDSHNKWRIFKKLGASHWAQNWNAEDMLLEILNDKLKPQAQEV